MVLLTVDAVVVLVATTGTGASYICEIVVLVLFTLSLR